MTQRCLGIIPARALSSRLPGKVLKDIDGKTLLQRVWEQAKQAKLITELHVATDDEKVAELAQSFGASVIMTSESNRTGSDRVAEAYSVRQGAGAEFDIIINIQGDMPFIQPEAIDRVIQRLANGPDYFGMSTIARPITELDEFLKTSVVKVVLGDDNGALYFSRAPIPFARDGFSEDDISEASPHGYKHIGLYAFRPKTLQAMSTWSSGLCENRECLEQLRALANGVRIAVEIFRQVELEPAIEVDTTDDLHRAIAYAKTLKRLT